jgi:hypothetical protein
LGHLLVAHAVGKPDVPQLFGKGERQSSHLCETFWRIIVGGSGALIHKE